MNPKRIKALRRRLGLSREAFGRLFGVSRYAVFRWENGERNPSGSALKLLEREQSQIVVGELQQRSAP